MNVYLCAKKNENSKYIKPQHSIHMCMQNVCDGKVKIFNMLFVRIDSKVSDKFHFDYGKKCVCVCMNFISIVISVEFFC